MISENPLLYLSLAGLGIIGLTAFVIWLYYSFKSKKRVNPVSSTIATPRIITKQLTPRRECLHGCCRWCGKSLSEEEEKLFSNECWSCTDDTRGPAAPKGQRSGHR